MFDNIPCEKCHSNQTDTKRSVYEKIIRVTQFDIICLPNSKLMQFVRASNNDPMLPTSSKTLPSLPFNYSRNTFRLPEPFKKLELIPSRPLSFVQEFTHSKQPINYKDDIIFELMQKNNWMAAELLALRKPISQSPLITIHPSTAAINKKQMSKNSSLSLSEDASWSSTQLEVFYTSDWVETLRTFKKEYDQSHSLQMSYVHQLGVLQNKIEVLQAELDSKNAFTFKLLNRTVGAESVTLEQLKTTEDYLKASKQDFQSALKKIQQLEAEVVVNMKLTITSNAEANVLKSKLLLMNEQYDFKEIQFADIHQANLTFKERIDSKNLTMESQVKEAREQEKRIKLLKASIIDLEFENYTLKKQRKVFNDVNLQTEEDFDMIDSKIDFKSDSRLKSRVSTLDVNDNLSNHVILVQESSSNHEISTQASLEIILRVDCESQTDYRKESQESRVSQTEDLIDRHLHVLNTSTDLQVKIMNLQTNESLLFRNKEQIDRVVEELVRDILLFTDKVTNSVTFASTSNKSLQTDSNTHKECAMNTSIETLVKETQTDEADETSDESTLLSHPVTVESTLLSHPASVESNTFTIQQMKKRNEELQFKVDHGESEAANLAFLTRIDLQNTRAELENVKATLMLQQSSIPSTPKAMEFFKLKDENFQLRRQLEELKKKK